MFKCDCCGCCCRNLQLSDLYSELDRGDGTCKYLVGNLCSIYEKYATAKSTTHNTHITMPNSILFIIVPAVACALPQFEQTGCPFSI